MIRRIAAIALLILFVFTAESAFAGQDVEYPKIEKLAGGTLKIHHPAIDSWDGFSTITAWIPVEVQLQGSDQTWVGSVRARASTRVDLDQRQVEIFQQEIISQNFAAGEVPQSVTDLASQAVSSKPLTISLDVLTHSLAEDFSVPAQGRQQARFNFDPPRIVVSDTPVALLLVDKEPVRAPISGTGLEFVVNTDWRLFYHQEGREWYVLNDGYWQRNSLLASGGWTTTTELPDDFRQLALGDQWVSVREALPARTPETEPNGFIVSLEPTELVVIDGEPGLVAIAGTGLDFVANADRDLFRLSNTWYLLAAGRWFQSSDLEGNWSAVSRLPAEFANIPDNHPKHRVRASVPGTVESTAALIEASIPRTRTVSMATAAEITVGYVGSPKFEPIEGTRLSRAVNTPFWVFMHNNYFYLMHDAAWYFSRNPKGPWQVALDVPDEIYQIPASDPSHIVTYVFNAPDSDPADDEVVFSHNSGYRGEYSTGSVVVEGTGWYYQPWLYNHSAGYPVYWSYPATYGLNYRHRGFYGHPFGYYGGYWGQQRVTLSSEMYGINGSADPAFQDPGVTRRGVDYSTLSEQRKSDGLAELNAADDLYTDKNGNVYKRSDQGWSQHTDSGWNTMAELERQYGGSDQDNIGQVEYRAQNEQAYKQNEADGQRMERYYKNRQRGYNMYGTVYVGR